MTDREKREVTDSARQCSQCLGLPCRKTSYRNQLPQIVEANGQQYVMTEICRHVQEETLIKKCRNAGIPRRYASKTYGDYRETAQNADALAISRWYIASKPRRWIYLYGGCGTGKTFLASLLAKEAIRACELVRFVDFQEILDELKDSFDDRTKSANTILNKYQECRLLILDDVGTGYFRDWGVSILHQLINYRYNEEKRTVITSNYDLNGLEERLTTAEAYSAARIISRIREMSEFANLGMEDRRYGE